MTRPELPWPTNDSRVREEWDFRARFSSYDGWLYGSFDFLPDTEVAYCNYYEIDRHSAEVDFILEKRKNCKEWMDWQRSSKTNSIPDLSLAAKAFDALLRNYYLNDGNGKSGFSPVLNWFYQIWPEWPEKPYLLIPVRERKRRFDAMWGKNKSRTLRVVPLVSIHKDFVAFGKGQLPRRFRYAHGPFTLGSHTWVIPSKASSEETNPTEVAAFEIDYSLSNKINLKRFENYLVQRRKERGYKGRGTTDLRVEKGRWRAELVALGAYRLIRSGLTYKQAAAFTKRKTGQSLYVHESAWSRATSRLGEHFGWD